MKILLTVLHTLGKLFVTLGNIELTRWRRIRRIRKCSSNPFSVLLVLVLLWRENIDDSFLFLLHHQETQSTALLNSLKKQEVCVINVGRQVNSSVLLLRKFQNVVV
jgi:hypothetical protein